MSKTYTIVTRTPEQYGMNVWRPPYNVDSTEMRARYVLPHLEALRADRDLFHPAGPYVSGQTEYSFASSSRPGERGGSDSTDVSPSASVFPETVPLIQPPVYHDISNKSTASAKSGDDASREVSSRRELIGRLNTFVRRRDAQRRTQDQLQVQVQQRAQKRVQSQKELLAQEQQRAQEYLQLETRRQAQEQTQIQALTDYAARIAEYPSNPTDEFEAIAARAACFAEPPTDTNPQNS